MLEIDTARGTARCEVRDLESLRIIVRAHSCGEGRTAETAGRSNPSSSAAMENPVRSAVPSPPSAACLSVSTLGCSGLRSSLLAAESGIYHISLTQRKPD